VKTRLMTTHPYADRKIHLPPADSLHDGAGVGLGRLSWVMGGLDLVDDQVEGLGDVLVVTGAGLGPAAAELVGERAAGFLVDLALLGPQVRLVADDDHRDGRGALAVRLSVTKKAGAPTRWVRIFSRITRTFSKLASEPTEYTMM
jgi:hypothetical protein